MADVSSNYVKHVKGLVIPQSADCDMLAALVEDYVETLPGHVDRIRNSVNHRETLEKSIRTMVSLLNHLGARWLQNEAENILNLIHRIERKVCERKVMSFIANLLALSIEMQTAKHHMGSGGASESDPRTIEYYIDIRRNLETVLELVYQSDYRAALDIVENMTVLSEEEAGLALVKTLKGRRDPSKLILELTDIYQKHIDRIRGEQAKAHHSILLVDDRPEILETVGGYLQDTYKVFALTGGVSALKFLEMQTPDLFILDIDMPDMDGITLAKKIRALHTHKSTPIMILTSNATRQYLVSAMQAGVNDFLVKPANKDLLIAKISKFLP